MEHSREEFQRQLEIFVNEWDGIYRGLEIFTRLHYDGADWLNGETFTVDCFDTIRMIVRLGSNLKNFVVSFEYYTTPISDRYEDCLLLLLFRGEFQHFLSNNTFPIP